MTGIETGALLSYLAVGSAAVGAVAAVSASQQQAAAEEYNAQVAENNATTARQQASAAEEAQRQRARQAIGMQLAATSASGTSLNGTNLDLLNDSLYNVALDSMNIRYEGELKANGLQAQAELDRSQASSTRTGGYLTAAGKLIGGSTSYLQAGTTVPYNYNGDSSGLTYSPTGDSIRGRR
jgi:hypothetical protein